MRDPPNAMSNDQNHSGAEQRNHARHSAASPANLQVFTRVVDVGYSSRRIRNPKLKFVTGDPFPFPSERLVDFRTGRIPPDDEVKAEWTEFEEKILDRIDGAIEENTLIILPEFAGSEKITAGVQKKLKATETNCIVVCGSYYRDRPVRSGGRKGAERERESVCPIVLPGGSDWPQLKFSAAPAERRYGMHEPDHRVLYIFQNTGFGDFAVLVCSDALLERCEPAIKALRDRVDLLVVVARNKSTELPNGLQTLAIEERWVVAYCNGIKEDSSVFSPLSQHRVEYLARHPEWLTGEIEEINDLLVTYGDAEERGEITEHRKFASRTRIGGFHPAPRHYAMSARSAMDFRRHAKVLAIGSHFDDIWLGCAATLMLLKEGYCAQIACVSLCTEYPHLYFGQYDLSDRIGELNRFCEELCEELGFTWIRCNLPGSKHLSDRGFSDNLPGLADRMRELWELYHDADLVFVPRHDDSHDDHVLTARAALAQFKKSTVLEYEVKEFRRIPFQPSVIVDVSRRSRKVLTLEVPNGAEGEQWQIFPPPSQPPEEQRAEEVRARRDRHAEYLFGGSPAQEAASAEDSFAWKKACILKYGFASFLGGEIPSTFEPEATLGRMRVRASESSGEPRFAEAFATEILIS